jgi:hypothetical protein
MGSSMETLKRSDMPDLRFDGSVCVTGRLFTPEILIKSEESVEHLRFKSAPHWAGDKTQR